MKRLIWLAMVASLFAGCSTVIPSIEEPTTTTTRKPWRERYNATTSTTSTTTTTAPAPVVPAAVVSGNPAVTYGPDVPARLKTMVSDAMKDAYSLGLENGCESIDVQIDDGSEYPELSSDAEAVTLSTTDRLGTEYPCTMIFRDRVTDGSWERENTVRHEVTHTFSVGDSHGSLFRNIEKKLVGLVGIEPFYFSGSEYPDCWKVSNDEWKDGGEFCTEQEYFDYMP